MDIEFLEEQETKEICLSTKSGNKDVFGDNNFVLTLRGCPHRIARKAIYFLDSEAVVDDNMVSVFMNIDECYVDNGILYVSEFSCS